MKFYVDKIPTSPDTCLFAEQPNRTYGDNKLIANCQLKCNTFPMVDGHPFSYVPNNFNCSLAANKKCPYLIRKE